MTNVKYCEVLLMSLYLDADTVFQYRQTVTRFVRDRYEALEALRSELYHVHDLWKSQVYKDFRGNVLKNRHCTVRCFDSIQVLFSGLSGINHACHLYQRTTYHLSNIDLRVFYENLLYDTYENAQTSDPQNNYQLAVDVCKLSDILYTDFMMLCRNYRMTESEWNIESYLAFCDVLKEIDNAVSNTKAHLQMIALRTAKDAYILSEGQCLEIESDETFESFRRENSEAELEYRFNTP